MALAVIWEKAWSYQHDWRNRGWNDQVPIESLQKRISVTAIQGGQERFIQFIVPYELILVLCEVQFTYNCNTGVKRGEISQHCARRILLPLGQQPSTQSVTEFPTSNYLCSSTMEFCAWGVRRTIFSGTDLSESPSLDRVISLKIRSCSKKHTRMKMQPCINEPDIVFLHLLQLAGSKRVCDV